MAKQTSEPIEHIVLREGRYKTWWADCGDQSKEIFHIKSERKYHIRRSIEYIPLAIFFMLFIANFIYSEIVPYGLTMESGLTVFFLFATGSACVLGAVVCIVKAVKETRTIKAYEAAHPKKRKRKKK